MVHYKKNGEFYKKIIYALDDEVRMSYNVAVYKMIDEIKIEPTCTVSIVLGYPIFSVFQPHATFKVASDLDLQSFKRLLIQSSSFSESTIRSKIRTFAKTPF